MLNSTLSLSDIGSYLVSSQSFRTTITASGEVFEPIARTRQADYFSSFVLATFIFALLSAAGTTVELEVIGQVSVIF